MKLLLTVLLFTFSLSIFAANKEYVGLQYGTLNYEETGFPAAKMQIAALVIGQYLNKNFAIEAHLISGIEEGNIVGVYKGTSYTAATNLENAYSLFIKGVLPINKQFSFYGLAGATSSKMNVVLTTNIGSANTITNTVSGSIGFGTEILFSKTGSITLAYISYVTKEEWKASSINLNLITRF